MLLVPPRAFPPISNQRLFGWQRPRLAFNSSLDLCKIIGPREAKKPRAMYAASMPVNQRAVALGREVLSAARRQEKKAGSSLFIDTGLHLRLCALIICTRYFAPQKPFCAINLLPDPYWANERT